MPSNDNSLIIRSGFQATHILPIVNSAVDLKHCKRLMLGGYDTTDFLLKLMQLKYPRHRANMTISKAEVCHLLLCN